MKTSLSSSQKPNKFVLQPIKACKTFEHFKLGITLNDHDPLINHINNLELLRMMKSSDAFIQNVALEGTAMSLVLA